MKKILISVMALVLVIGLVGAGAFAYFSDTETSTGNTFTAGTLDLQVGTANPLASALVTLPDLKPCEAHLVETTVSNVGTNPGDLYMRYTTVLCGEGTTGYLGFSSEPEWTMAQPPTSLNTCALDSAVLVDLLYNGGFIIPNDPPSATIYLSQAVTHGWYLLKSDMATTDDNVVVGLSFHMWAPAGNEYQGDTCSFTIEFLLTQVGVTPVNSGY